MHTFTDMVVGAGIGAGDATEACYKVFFHCITKSEVIYAMHIWLRLSFIYVRNGSTTSPCSGSSNISKIDIW